MTEDKRLTKRLMDYWDRLRRDLPLPPWEQFNIGALADVWGQCCVWRVEVANSPEVRPQFMYEYVGDSAQEALGRNLTGMIFISHAQQFAGARITKRINEVVASCSPITDEGSFVNEKNKTVKYRSCLLPFGTKEGKVTHIVLGLSWEIVLKPFLKWAGNKYRIIDRIRRLLPEGKRLIEPFVGSGAVFLNTDYASALLTDSNADLITLYRVLQQEGERFIRYSTPLFMPENNNVEAYYALRDEFNASCDKRRKAALFLYLNRHGYNGLCRYNASGEFNVPLGRYVKPYFPAEEMLAFHAKAQRAEFQVADFRDVMRQTKRGDVVYCDPPYVPLTRTANFTAYGAGGFGEEEQRMLAKVSEELAARGVPVVISNHDTSFTMRAYKNASLTRFSVQRFISSNGQNRSRAGELLALFGAGEIDHAHKIEKLSATAR